MSEVKVQLGRFLFYEKRLSSTQSISCASCHKQSHAFTDERKTSVGETGDRLSRNAMSLVNLAYRHTFGWSDSSVRHLEQQMKRPLFAESPIEMGAQPFRQQILTRLERDEYYPRLFRQAFPSEKPPLNWKNIIRSIACFERTLISGQSAYDLWLFSDIRPSQSVVRGMQLFFSSELDCGACHGGIGFNNEFYFQEFHFQEFHFQEQQRQNLQYHFTGLTGQDLGLGEATKKGEDNFFFKAPSLRNIAVTAPYMHDGRFQDLESVIRHYERGPAPEHLLGGFPLTGADRQDLISFLNSLTDEKFLSDKFLADPASEVKN